MQPAKADISALKARMRDTWMAGDFGEIARYTVKAAQEFISRLNLKKDTLVLDVACGTGNTAIPEARTGAKVTGVDIATNLLDQARERAAQEGLTIDFREGDAEKLPFPDASFDVVVSMFGAMFAPRPELVAAELLRVCRPGGLIAMANWTPAGFVGKTFALTSKHVPPPPGVPAPVLWGDPAVVKQRFGAGAKDIRCTPVICEFAFPFSPAQVVEHFRRYFGPTQTAFNRLDAAGQAALAADMEKLWAENNLHSGPDRVIIHAEYLEVLVRRA